MPAGTAGSGPEPGFEVTRRGGDTVVVRLEGRLGASSAGGVRRAFKAAVGAQAPRIVVDFSDVTLVMSYVMKELWLCLKDQARREGDVVFAGLGGLPLRTLRHSGILAEVANCRSLEAALMIPVST